MLDVHLFGKNKLGKSCVLRLVSVNYAFTLIKGPCFHFLSASLQTDLFGSAHNLLDVFNLLQILMFSLGAVTFSKIGLVKKIDRAINCD